MGDQATGQAQTPPNAVQDLAMHVFGGLPPTGGKFTMDTDQLNDAIKQWNDLLGELREDARVGREMGGLNAAGSPLEDFVTGYITKLTAVRDGHTEADQAGADHLKKA
jgi:hypothetical protein